MVIVYVKHYLTQEGIEFVKTSWFSRVFAAMSKQDGFVRFTQDSNNEEKDCVYLSIIFKDQKSLDAWCAHPSHDKLICSLDAFRSRDYWKAVKTEDAHAEPSTLMWETYFI